MNENEHPVESEPQAEPVPVVLAELPRITFEWATIAVRNILLALLFWCAIIAAIGGGIAVLIMSVVK